MSSRAFLLALLCGVGGLVLLPGAGRAQAPAAAVTAAPLPTVLVTPVEITDRDLYSYAENVRSQLEGLVSQEGFATPIERKQLEGIAGELALNNYTDLMDQSKALRLGRASGAKLFLTATLQQPELESKSFQGYGISTNQTVVSVPVAIRLYDVETTKVLFSKSYTGSASSSRIDSSESSSSDLYGKAIKSALTKFTKDKDALGTAFAKAEPMRTNPGVQVTITSVPRGATVELNGQAWGVTPLRLTLAQGQLLGLNLHLAGYFDYQTNIKAENGLKVGTTLTPVPAPRPVVVSPVIIVVP